MKRWNAFMIDPGLENKVVLVTGANNPYGIGAATATAFAAQGARVFIHFLWTPTDLSEADVDKASVPGEAFYRAQQNKTADEILHIIRERGGQAAAWEADLVNPAIIPTLFDRVEATFGPVDILVNNAAHGEPDTFIPSGQLRKSHPAPGGFPMTTITPEIHDRHFAVNGRIPRFTLSLLSI